MYIISQLIIAGNLHERHLMVHRIDAGNVQPIFTLTQPLQDELRLIDAELSQNGQAVALSTIVRPWEQNGFATLNLIDGTTGQVLQNLTDTEQGLCELHWSGTSTLIIKLGASLNCANHSSVTGFASFDVITSMTTLLTDGDAFFLPRLR